MMKITHIIQWVGDIENDPLDQGVIPLYDHDGIDNQAHAAKIAEKYLFRGYKIAIFKCNLMVELDKPPVDGRIY